MRDHCHLPTSTQWGASFTALP